jgi:hypothetical protein
LLESGPAGVMLHPDMKRILIVALLVSTAALGFAAEEAGTNLPAAPAAAAPVAAVPAGAAQPGNVPKPKALTPEEQAQYNRLTRGELELSTQHKLLTELADEHARRAETAKAISLDQSRWEILRAQELRVRSSQVLTELNEMTKERLAFEKANAAPAAPMAGQGAVQPGRALTVDELAYVVRLDEHLLRLRQEVVTLSEATQGLYAELQTNNTVEVMQKVSARLDENAKQVRDLEREQALVELKKLEFRALRR